MHVPRLQRPHAARNPFVECQENVDPVGPNVSDRLSLGSSMGPCKEPDDLVESCRIHGPDHARPCAMQTSPVAA
eukprot:scaffold287_cov337-Pavlova_lutheri.AAC.32